MTTEPKQMDNEMLEDYDFSRATRGNPYRDRLNRTVTIETTDGPAHVVQIKTVELIATIAEDGTTTLKLPPNITPGTHRITLLIQEEQM